MEKKQVLFIVLLLIVIFLSAVSIFFYLTISFGTSATGHVVFNSSSAQDTDLDGAGEMVEPRSERVVHAQTELEFETKNAKVSFD